MSNDSADEAKKKVDQEIVQSQHNDHQDPPPKSHSDILIEQICDAEHTFQHTPLSLGASAFTAGLEIGFSYLLLLVAHHMLSPYLPAEWVFKSFALFYPVGFIMVVIGQSLLFTEQTSLLSLPVLNNRQPFTKLLKLWITVILGNLLGGWLFVMGTLWLGPELGLFTPEDSYAIAHHVINHPFHIIFASAILAGWLMGLLSWLVTSADSTTSRIIIVFLLTGSIALMGLHHSIVGNVEAFAGLISSEHIHLSDYLNFQISALLGNTIGGATFVAVLKYHTFILNK